MHVHMHLWLLVVCWPSRALHIDDYYQAVASLAFLSTGCIPRLIASVCVHNKIKPILQSVYM